MGHLAAIFSASRARVACACIVLFALGSCGSDASFRQHFDARTWRTGWAVTTSEPERWLPAAILAGVTPLAWITDKDVSEDSTTHHLFNTDTQYGDELALAFGAVPLVIGAVDGLSGDDGRFLAVSTESLALTMASTYALKYAVNRQRPGGQGEDSFPSGHTAMAFAGATLLQRTIADRAGEGWGAAAYLLYVPASYVAISRLEGDRHYLADVLFGAALGMFTTHLVYDAHYGDPEHDGLFPSRSRLSMSVFPTFDDGSVGVGLAVSF